MASVDRVDEPAAFLERAEALLARSEARHNLIYGIAGTLVRDPGAYESHAMWIAERDGAVVAAALRTAPYNLLLADAVDEAAVGVLAARVAADDSTLPGVSANRPTDRWFVDAWTELTGASAVCDMAQGVFALERVLAPPEPPGAARRANELDTATLESWYAAFAAEAVPNEPAEPESIARVVGDRIARRHGAGVWLWEVDGRSVSLCGHGNLTPNGVRIGPVYTPPAHRGNGYATALVAHRSAALLAAGRTFCFLFTDLANPTSNAIYRRIGYEQVAEAAMWRFVSDSS